MSDNKENPLTDHDAHIFSAWYHCVSPSSNLANFSDESNIVLPESSRIDTEINEYTNMINLTEKFYNNEQFIELVVPQHEHRAAMESIITKPDQPGSKARLITSHLLTHVLFPANTVCKSPDTSSIWVPENQPEKGRQFQGQNHPQLWDTSG